MKALYREWLALFETISIEHEQTVGETLRDTARALAMLGVLLVALTFIVAGAPL